MTQITDTFITLVCNPVPEDTRGAKLWARRHLDPDLCLLRKAADDRAPDWVGALSATLNVLVVSAAYLAQRHPDEAADALGQRLEAAACCITAELDAEHAADNVA